MESYERIILVKPEVFVYRIPPRSTARGYRAADWNLDKPDWILRLRVIAKDKTCAIRLEDKTSGELFGECPVDTYPGSAVESVTDSSRYFVLRIQDPSGRSAFLGLGFGDRSDSFDLNVALQDHFKWVATSEQINKEEASDQKPRLDLAFKEGQMIKINIGKKSSTTTKAPSTSTGAVPGLLPPPPGAGGMGIKLNPPTAPIAPPNAAASNVSQIPAVAGASGLLDFDPMSSGTPATTQPIRSTNEWGDYSTGSAGSKSTSDTSWMNF
ncbi:NECAP-like protein CG9132 [Paramacrobiotus metropolitanus]|uniref:NECAP-like protein CG9132 n=1 Tax=Paramacrobiotus metropolitanus TaxID=2943436 RepID=UPI002445E11C|nr:NECAP-like protein CG9132 [Paramacrobiotus metropolitanus]